MSAKEWQVQFVSGELWLVRELTEASPDYSGPFNTEPEATGFWDIWRVERVNDNRIDGQGKRILTSMGIWTINMSNVEAIKES